MILTLLTVIIVFLILIGAEYLSRAKRIHAELTRKLIHVSVGTFVAFWPFFLSWREIQGLSIAFFLVVVVSARLNIFRSIHAVERNVVGEILFAVSIGMVALIATNKWVFMASVLHMSLADGIAAVVGLGWGDTNRYKVFGSTKSRAGSAAFLVTSFLIMLAYGMVSPTGFNPVALIFVPLIATASENLAVQGTDNLVTPLLVCLLLTSSL